MKHTKMVRATTRALRLSWICLLPLAACNCEDEVDAKPWEFREPRPDIVDIAPDLDMAPDLDIAPDLDMPEDITPDLDMEPDLEDMLPDLPPPEEWEPEVVVEVPRAQALNDRTSLGVGQDNTVWLGYHSCGDVSCSNPKLTVAYRKAEATDTPWRLEEIAPQQGTFGLDVFGNQPFVAYLDDLNNEFRVGMRLGPNQWMKEALPVQYTGLYDGLDLTHDDVNMYITFANSNGDPVSLFGMDMTRAVSQWIKLRSLDVGKASAALERGLKADGKGNLYLVHRDGEFGPYGVARYRLRDNIWDRRTYFPNTNLIVSSMEARANGDVCLSSANVSNRDKVTLTCGRISKLERDQYTLEDETTQEYNSLIEGRDGSLIIAYSYGNRERLKIARRYPGGAWDVRTVFTGPTYGVSTAIDKNNKLLISYYTCRFDRCTLEFLRQPY